MGGQTLIGRLISSLKYDRKLGQFCSQKLTASNGERVEIVVTHSESVLDAILTSRSQAKLERKGERFRTEDAS